MITRVRDAAIALALVAVSTLVVLVPFELWLRRYDLRWTGWYSEHPLSPRLIRIEPGTSPYLAGALVEANSAGYRGPDRPREKPPGSFRIAILGDSMTFGWDVREDETYPRQLEARLVDRYTARRVEVHNFGMIGFNTSQEAEACSLDVFPFEPDVVLFGVFMNDVDPPIRITDYSAGRSPGRSSLRSALVRTRTYNFLRPRVAALLRSAGVVTKGSATIRYRDLFLSRGKEWDDCRTALVATRDACALRGIRFGVVILPFMVSLDENYPMSAVHEQIASFCREEGIPVRDLLPVYMGRNASKLCVTPLDNHMNAAGHAIAAEEIDRWMGETRFLAASR